MSKRTNINRILTRVAGVALFAFSMAAHAQTLPAFFNGTTCCVTDSAGT